MSEAHGEAHGAGNEKKPNSIDDVVKYVGSSIAGAGVVGGGAYLFALPVALPAAIGAIAVPALLKFGPALYNTISKYIFSSDKKDDHKEEHPELAMAGGHADGGHG